MYATVRILFKKNHFFLPKNLLLTGKFARKELHILAVV